jgi:hypothetical protein
LKRSGKGSSIKDLLQEDPSHQSAQTLKKKGRKRRLNDHLNACQGHPGAQLSTQLVKR